MQLGYTPISNLKINIDYDVNENIEYVGYAAPGSTADSKVWKIIKLEYNVSGDITNLVYAKGNLIFDKIWDNRASYTYS